MARAWTPSGKLDTERISELEQELVRLRQLVDRSPDLLFLHDLHGRVREINRSVHERLGYTREEFLKLRVGDFNPDVGRIPKDRLGENWAKMPLGSSVTVETHVSRKDGSELPVEMLVAPFDDQGERMFVAVGRDISERKAAEAARHRDEMRFEAVFQGAPTGLVLVDDQGTIVAANPALERMLQAPRGSLVGRGIADITVETEVHITRRALAELRLGEREYVRAETRYRGPSGKIVWAELSAFRYQDPETEDHRTVVFIEDISERKRIEEQRREMFERLDELVAKRTAALEAEIAERKRTERELSKATRAAEAANLAKSQFLASMSHELRTPLNAVIGYSEMLVEEIEDTGEGADYVADLERIRNAGKHLLHIINDILDLSKIEAGKIELYIEEINLRELLRETVATVQPLADGKRNELELSIDVQTRTITTDVTRVRQVLFNLMSNACKFTEDGRVELRVREHELDGRGWICCEIEDSGVGIKPEQLAKLFQPFTQADASTSRRFGGTGLGLSISDRFAKMLGGYIEVQSEFGVGSTFSLWLPILHSKPIERRASERPAPVGGGAGTVLVVDDESEHRNTLVELLEAEGYAVITAPNGTHALELAARHKPDIITLDVLMPELDGWATLQRLKDQPELADIPVVIVSMKPDNDMGYALGAADVLPKPIERGRLLGILDRFGAGGPRHVLVVDDDPGARELIRRAVVKGGWHVQEARNGVEALASMRARKPRLVVLDLMMPEMDGFEVLEHLRADPKLRSLPVIVVTAKELGEEERRSLSQRVGSIMQKASYSRSDLIDHLRELMDRSMGAKPDDASETSSGS